MTPRRRFAALLVASTLTAGGALAQLKLPGQSSGPGGSAGPTLAPPPSAPLSPAPGPAPSAAPREGPAAAASGAAAPGADTTQMREAAQFAAQGWLLLLDRRDWGTAWDTGAAMFRSSVPLGTWMDGIPKARAPLGKLIERKPLDAVYRNELQGRPKGDYVTVLFAAKFENKPDAQEIVTTVREPDGKWRVTGYSTK